MKNLRIFVALAALVLISAAASAQTNPQTQITWPRVTGSGAPTATCPSATNTTTTATVGTPYTNTAANTQYVCSTGGWTLLAGGGSGGVSTVAGAAGNRAASVVTTGANVVITTFDQQLYASQFSTIPALITACGGANTKITVDTAQSFTLASNQTFPANCYLNFTQQGVWTIAGSFSLTIGNGTITATPSQHFAGAATILGMHGADLPQWWGAVAYSLNSTAVATAAAGPDDSAKMASAIAAIAGNGWVELTCNVFHFDAVTVTTSQTGIIGDCPSYVIGSAIGTTIVSNSAGGNIVSGQGASSSALATFITFEGFSVQRAVAPTSGAAGIYGQYLDNWTVKNVQSGDSFYGLYSNFTPGSTNGSITGFGALWGFSVVSASALPSGMQGIFLDSTNGNAESSITISGGQAACQSAGAKAGGLQAAGIALSDMYVKGFQTSGCNIGVDLENTGTSNFVTQDILLNDMVLNTCITACLKINGMGSTTDIAPHVYVRGGNFFATGASAVGALIENSSNVAMTGVQVFTGGTNTQTDISLISVDGFQVNHNQLDGDSLVNISCASSTHGTINDNQIKTGGTATGIKNVGCTQVSEQGNSIAGNGGSNLAVGMSFDAGSSNNGPWSLNAIDSATVTTPVTDAGTHNNDPQTNSSRMSQFTSTVPGVVSASGGGTTNFLRADNTWVAPSGGSATVIQVNGTPTSTATPVNLQTSTANSVGLTITPSNPSVGNVKYEITGAAYTGTAANLSGTPALPNGTTATTQSPADNTTKLATDAFVNAAVGAANPTFTNIASGINSSATMTCGAGCTINRSGGTIDASLFLGNTWASPQSIGSSVPATGAFTTLSATTPIGVASGGTGAGTFTIHGVLTGQTTGIFHATAAGATNAVFMGQGSSVDPIFVAQPVIDCTNCTNLPAGGNTTSTSLTTNTVPRANGANSIIDSAFTDNGTTGGFARAGGFAPTHLISADFNTCADTSGSGTAQVCNSVASFTPVVSCILYTTTTTNSGTGLTLNVNSFGAKSVAIPGASGWTTTLTASIIPANKPLNLCYDGTNWNVQQTGTSASGSGVTGSGVAFGPAYWNTTSTIAGLATPVTGTLWWLGTSSAPRASTTGDTAALSISGTAALATSIASGATSQIPFQTGAGATGFSANLTWDNTNGRLLIGAPTSIAAISLVGGTTAAGGVNFGDAFVDWYRFSAGVLKSDANVDINGALLMTGTGSISGAGSVSSASYLTATNCASAASPAVCAAAPAGAIVIAAAATSVTVNTTKVTANSEIEITPDSSLGTRLGVTCNTSLATIIGPVVTARTAGTSFTVSITGTLVTNPACYTYTITN